MVLEYSKVRKQVITPVRANPSDAGLDVFFCPDDDKNVYISSGKNKLLQTGLKFAIPHGYMLQAMNRSGVAAKKELLVGACVIDSGYSGEVFIDLHNVGIGDKEIKAGDKIAQLVLIPIIPFKLLEVEESNLYNYPITISNRKEGALGSTGN